MMRMLLTSMLLIGRLTSYGQGCRSSVVTNYSTSQSLTASATNLTLSATTSGTANMIPTPGCPLSGGITHTAYASFQLTTKNQLQDPAFMNADGSGWNWGQSGATGGWTLAYAGLPTPGLGYSAMFQGTGTAMLSNLQNVAVTPGNQVTGTVYGLGEPGAAGQAKYQVFFYGATGNLISVVSSPTNVTNNYIWTRLSITATAPTGTAYAHFAFTVANKTTTAGRWFVTDFVGTNSYAASANASYANCWNCYLNATATKVQALGNDTAWSLNFWGSALCSAAGMVYGPINLPGTMAIAQTYGKWVGGVLPRCNYNPNCYNTQTPMCGPQGWQEPLPSGQNLCFDYIKQFWIKFDIPFTDLNACVGLTPTHGEGPDAGWCTPANGWLD